MPATDATDNGHGTACQLCHTIALTPLVWPLGTTTLPDAQPQASVHHFSSAERAPGFKPPIF